MLVPRAEGHHAYSSFMKKRLWCVALVAALATVVGCGGDDRTTERASAGSTAAGQAAISDRGGEKPPKATTKQSKAATDPDAACLWKPGVPTPDIEGPLNAFVRDPDGKAGDLQKLASELEAAARPSVRPEVQGVARALRALAEAPWDRVALDGAIASMSELSIAVGERC